jgi:carboxypeptidase C (cathepsin A)
MSTHTTTPTATTTATTATTPSTPAAPVIAPPQDNIVTTKHTLKLKGQTLKYSATCGTVVLREESEKDGAREGNKARAQMFYIAYTLEGVKKSATRPVLFSFNGGPGSSSVWLHLGLAGPKRVVCDAFGNPTLPHRLTDNEHTLLAQADLVFIDPIGTGFSRMVEGEKTKEFHDYQRDLESVAEFIRLYLSRTKRWNSPKYLMGESYGTTRAAGLSQLLQDKYGLALNGIALVSCAIDFQTLCFDHGNDLPYTLYLPTFAATAWYHKALAPAMQRLTLKALIAQAEQFANTDYHLALLQGSRLSAKDTDSIASRMAELCGLSKDYVLRSNLRVTDMRFFKELLRGRGQVTGRLDSRFTGYDKDSAGETMEADPSGNALVQAYSSCINQYLREDLTFTDDSPYHALAPLWDKWSYKDFTNKYVNVGDSLRRAMHSNPAMKIYVASGYYDLATPHAAGDFTLAHLGLHESFQKNISLRYFEAGHMMYIHQPSLTIMASDLKAFLKTT